MSATLTLHDAASRLGVSERTLLHRIKNGALIGRQVATPQGYRWLVDIGDAALVAASDSEDWQRLVEERDGYRDLLVEIRGELAAIRALLEQAPGTRPAVNAAPAGQAEPPRVSWWRRLFGAFVPLNDAESP